MRISELTGAELAEALCLIAQPIENITQDDEIVDAFRVMAEEKKKGNILVKAAGLAYARFIPLLLRKHRDDTFAILSTFSGKSIEKLEKENGLQLFQDIKKIMSADVVSFFSSSVDMEAEK